MKKAILTCVFGVVVIVALFGNEGAQGSSKKTYEVGDEGAGGGIVFYVSQKGFYVYDGEGGKVRCHYLEMSKDALGETRWFPDYNDIDKKTGVGYGKANTYNILKKKESKSLTKENCAAYICSTYSTENAKAGEWWLPSKDELTLMYENQKDYILENYKNWVWYWSSSDSSDTYAWALGFRLGDWGDYDKIYGKYSVRAIRAF